MTHQNLGLSVGVTLSLLITIVAFGAFASDSDDPAVMPTYDDQGRLLLPADFRQWIFAGSSLGLTYSQGEPAGEMFHHTLIEPTAYRHFVDTGEFREGTMLALLLHDKGTGVLPGRAGEFADQLQAVELAVKDSGRVDERWAYYNFGSRKGLLDSARPFPASSCHDCHLEHARHDNVFLQFYPLLAEAAPATAAFRSITSSKGSEVAAGPVPALRQSEDAEPQQEGRLVLAGLDPIALIRGREELGKPEIVEVHEGYRYQFVSEPHRAEFASDPERYGVQNDSCLVVRGAPNNPELWAVHDERIYLFATEGCVQSFEARPDDYVGGS